MAFLKDTKKNGEKDYSSLTSYSTSSLNKKESSFSNGKDKDTFFFLGFELGSKDEAQVKALQASLTNVANALAEALKILRDNGWIKGRLGRRILRFLDQVEKDRFKLGREFEKAREREYYLKEKNK